MIANRPLLASFCAVAFISANLAQAQNSLSPEGQAWLQTTIASGHSDLRWPDFSDYSKHVKKFYDFNGNSLWWVKGLEPTSQARQVITVLQQADQKGLSAGDYDAALWNGRVAKLKPAARQPAEADAVKFDLALTVCLMRYISDLHIGKVNPKHFAFALDEEPRKYDLAEFLKTASPERAMSPPSWPKWNRPIPATATRFKLSKRI